MDLPEVERALAIAVEVMVVLVVALVVAATFAVVRGS